MILLLDNYDSFVHNVARALRELGGHVHIVRADALTVAEAVATAPSHLVVSPGPRTPTEAGISVEVIRALGGRTPVLGICLGHQAVAEAYGGQVVPSPDPVHGSTREIVHRGSGILDGLPSPFAAGLYHSLTVSPELPGELVAEAWTSSGEIMALRHRLHPVWGVQFHPESILTPVGSRILETFLRLSAAGIAPLPAAASPTADRGGATS